jgi:hypothetical protein
MVYYCFKLQVFKIVFLPTLDITWIGHTRQNKVASAIKIGYGYNKVTLV